jgi:hypothetical protein
MRKLISLKYDSVRRMKIYMAVVLASAKNVSIHSLS